MAKQTSFDKTHASVECFAIQLQLQVTVNYLMVLCLIIAGIRVEDLK